MPHSCLNCSVMFIPAQLHIRRQLSGLGSWTTKAPGLLKRAAGLSAEPVLDLPEPLQDQEDASSAPERLVCMSGWFRLHASIMSCMHCC